MSDIEYSDQKRKGLFNGNGIDYIRMRADKHEKIYNCPKQAEHLRRLADELELKCKLIDSSRKFLKGRKINFEARQVWPEV